MTITGIDIDTILTCEGYYELLTVTVTISRRITINYYSLLVILPSLFLVVVAIVVVTNVLGEGWVFVT